MTPMDMVDRCMDAMGFMMGGGIMGIMLMLLVALLLWIIGLAAVGALLFWGVRRLSTTRSDDG